MRYICFIFLYLVPITKGIAFSDPVKFGVLTEKDKRYYHSEYPAVILSSTRKITNLPKTSTLIITDRKKIKIFNKHFAYPLIFHFRSKNSYEKIYGFKALIHFKDQGVWKKKTLKTEHIHYSKVSEDWSELKVILPTLNAGDIVEYKYFKNSKNILTLGPWNFQEALLTLQSAIEVDMPSSMDYKVFLKGKALNQKYKTKDGNKWALENLPPIVQEKHALPISDRCESIQFQLSGYYTRKPNGAVTYHNVLNNWEVLVDMYRKRVDAYFNKPSILKQYLLDNNLIGESEETTTNNIINHCHLRIKNTGHNGILPRSMLNKILITKKATAEEVTLTSIALLKAAGINTNIVLCNRLDQGKINSEHPIFEQFKSLALSVAIGNSKRYYQPSYSVYPLLHPGFYERKALEISEDVFSWTTLTNKFPSFIYLDLYIDLVHKTVEGSYQIGGHFIQPNMVSDFILNRDSIGQKVILDKMVAQYTFRQTIAIDSNNWPFFEFPLSHYRNPIPSNYLEEHSDRSTPLHLPFPYKEKIKIRIKKNKNITVLEKLKVANRIINNNTKLKLVTSATNDWYDLSYTFQIGTTQFSAKEYPYIRSFEQLKINAMVQSVLFKYNTQIE